MQQAQSTGNRPRSNQRYQTISSSHLEDLFPLSISSDQDLADESIKKHPFPSCSKTAKSKDALFLSRCQIYLHNQKEPGCTGSAAIFITSSGAYTCTTPASSVSLNSIWVRGNHLRWRIPHQLKRYASVIPTKNILRIFTMARKPTGS